MMNMILILFSAVSVIATTNGISPIDGQLSIINAYREKSENHNSQIDAPFE